MIKNNISFTFTKITQNDIPTLLGWFKEPHVSKWWPILGEKETIEHFLKRIRSPDTFGYLVFCNAIPIGYIQYYYINPIYEKAGSWLPQLPKTTIGTDQFIGDPNYIGKGYGVQFIKEFVKYLDIIEPHITTIIVDPDPQNAAAIKCYEKVGFAKVGIYNTPHGSALLMKYAK